MVISCPVRGGGKPRLVASFPCPTQIVIQVIGPNTIFLASTDSELMQNPDGNQTVDGIQFTNTNATVPVVIWWSGDLWAAANIANSSFVLMVLGPSSKSQVPEVLSSGADPVDQAVSDYSN